MSAPGMHGRSARRPRRGMALMEAMVAVLLLSMSALGYAALQLRGLSSNSSALWRSKASLLAADMADRLRANQAGVGAGAYNSLTTVGSSGECGNTTACNPTRMAVLDHAQWNTTLGRELPGGSGVVCLDSTPDDGTATEPACDSGGAMFAVKVFWKERGEVARLVLPVRP